MDNTIQIPWYVIYSRISKALSSFKDECEFKKLDVGDELYTLLNSNPNYRENNKWIDKFENEFGLQSLDPMHIFASISSKKLSNEERYIRINCLLQLLKQGTIETQISLEGCPTPAVIYQLAVRNKNNQDQVWDLFERVFIKGRTGLIPNDFKNYKSWYGIDISSFTILLYWINSDHFLPLDKNTRQFINLQSAFSRITGSYHNYSKLIKLINDCNYDSANDFGNNSIFREIVYKSYQLFELNKENVQYSDALISLLNPSKLIEHSIKSVCAKQEISFDSKVIAEPRSHNLENYQRISQLGFKIVAIKPLDNCDQKYLNILKKNAVYYLDNSFEIHDDIIKFVPDNYINLYNKENTNNVHINVSAIVGKNGCGKSSLIELFFRIINNIAFKQKSNLSTKDIIREPNLNVEFYYVISGKLFKLVIIDKEVIIREYVLNNENIFYPKSNSYSFKKIDFKDFFYTIAVNYSHYALNSKHLGAWIQKMFHKNDAYQTPLVINPMRTEGNININTENDLVRSRLLANLLGPTSDNDIGLLQLTDNLKVDSIKFTLIPNKTKYLFYREIKKGKFEPIPLENLQTDRNDILNKIKDKFLFPEGFKDSERKPIIEIQNYIISKLAKTASKYAHYKDYFLQDIFEFVELDKFLQEIKDDQSHVCYKLKQAIYYWRELSLWPRKSEFKISIDEGSDRLQKFLISKKDEKEKIELIELLPPPIFKSEILLRDEQNPDDDIPFDSLSSGEKQLIYSSSSILYHLRNLDSVSEKNNLIKYRNVNIILDEIELYYHPELQRKYLDYLISLIRKVDFLYIEAVNICLVTHSPYILSDIPNTFTLKLCNGKPVKDDNLTFGANIHDLLANDFFMNNGYMGEFAKNKIEETIRFLNLSSLDKKEKLLKLSYFKDKSISLKRELILLRCEFEDMLNSIRKQKIKVTNTNFEKIKLSLKFENEIFYKKIISSIGEPIIRTKLESMYEDVFNIDHNSKMKQLLKLAHELGVEIKSNFE